LLPQLYFRLFCSGGWGHRGMRVPLGRAYAQNMHSLDSGRLVKIAHPGIARPRRKKTASVPSEAVKEGHLAISTLAHVGGSRLDAAQASTRTSRRGAAALPPTLPPNYPDQEVEYRLMREREAGEARPLLEELRRLLEGAKGRGRD
jgi:hypothetical protein